MQYGLTFRKSLTLQFPNIPQKFLCDFIRGYFDGDGSMVLTQTKYNVYGQVSFTCGSIDFLVNLQKILKNMFGIDSQIYNGGHPDTQTMSLKITKRSAIEMFSDLIYNDTDLYLLRKYNKFQELNKHPLKYKK